MVVSTRRKRVVANAAADESVVVEANVRPSTVAAKKSTKKKKTTKEVNSKSSIVPKTTTTRGKRRVVATADASNVPTVTSSPRRRPRRVGGNNKRDATTPAVVIDVDQEPSSTAAVDDDVADVVVVATQPLPKEATLSPVVAVARRCGDLAQQRLQRAMYWVLRRILMVALFELVALAFTITWKVVGTTDPSHHRRRNIRDLGGEIVRGMMWLHLIWLCLVWGYWLLVLSYRIVCSYIRAFCIGLRASLLSWLLLALFLLPFWIVVGIGVYLESSSSLSS